ncbi:hypothetical protein E1B28_011528 [Marasmius oreades]|uniref:Uncharacterized protein n=1 Tax=Marasmius oreades TaxID=181124 RepID=A0A9P7RUB6_9AGAR|nr:uncharacterized protein E1B28_011528 [Marasmius oreades]KAG7089894.1 hypothetical protein E1B28_011528 [Marasmius oreades]
MIIGGLEMNDYDIISLHIPYSPGWDIRINEIWFFQDLAPFNPKNKDRRLHRHPAFFGMAEECLGDCYEFCPDPVDEDELKLQKEEDEQYDPTTERPSSEDDWSSDDNGVVSMNEDAEEDIDENTDEEVSGDESDSDDASKKGNNEPLQTPNPGKFLDEKEDKPDVFDINAADWDFAFTPLDYAILFASMPVIDVLLDEPDIDLSIGTKAKYHGAPTIHPLTLTMYHEDENEAVMGEVYHSRVNLISELRK